MFGFLKNLLQKSQNGSAETAAAEAPAYNAPEAVAQTHPYPGQMGSSLPPTRRTAPYQNGKGIEISLQNILNTLPLELHPRVRQPDVGELTISVPLEKILAQLSRGAVKISFGELRQAAPEVFTSENDRDRVLVALPLADVLSRLNPALITRRRVQRQIEVPADITSPFDDETQSMAFPSEPTQPEPEPAPVAPPRHAPVPLAPITPIAPAPARNGIASVPTAAVPAAPPLVPFRPNPTPAPKPAKAATGPIPFIPRPAPAAAAPARPVPLRLESRESNGRDTLPAPAAAPAAPRTGAQAEPLMVALTALAEGWPEAVRKEILQLNLVEVKIALPVTAVEQALKQGRIAFAWKTLRSWIKPAVLPSVSAHDSLVLELPLRVVAPLFLARQQEAAKHQHKVAVDEEIPNLFFGAPRPETGPGTAAATARPADTNFYVWDESSDVARVDETDVKRGPSPGTKFVAKYATPNEVVSRAAGLEGVTGALIALPDGLMVANRLPAELNADTLAAFLPQIFGKVSQCTKELRMGELNNLNFTVGNVPWKIFRVNSIFFAAFGKAGEPLPTAQLAALAAELDHKAR